MVQRRGLFSAKAVQNNEVHADEEEGSKKL